MTQDTAYTDFLALSMLVLQDGGVDALNWWLNVIGDGTDAERLERGRIAWGTWRNLWIDLKQNG